MELLRLRRRVAIAKRGHKLLRDKQEELVRWFMKLIYQWKSLRKELEDKLAQAFGELVWARAGMPQEALETAVSFPKGRLVVDINQRRTLTVPVLEFSVKEMPQLTCYGAGQTTESLDSGLLIFRDSFEKLIKLSELESTIKRLAEEIERTRRRVNALEYVLIPSLLETIRFITMKLSEYERANLTRLMRVKEVVRAK